MCIVTSMYQKRLIKRFCLALIPVKPLKIRVKFLRASGEVLAFPLRHIIISSIKLSIFPNECKIAKLKPILKKDARIDLKNCRPISLLPLVSKIIEKSIHFQKLIYMYPSGFRTNHSTDFCLALLIDFVLTGMDKQIHTCMILIVLQKAFDSFDHGVLLEKMKQFSSPTSVFKWFESYLSNRKFLVCIDNVFSEAGTLKYGIAQGFILGPLYSSPIIIKSWLLFVCRRHLHFLPT